MKTETAYFVAGCFWGVEYEFSKIKGVLKTEVGYMGGKINAPSYKNVCLANSGEKETVKVVFNPEKISYSELLSPFWNMHDPTSMDMQGMDVGEQYRSVIFFIDERQKKEAEDSLRLMEHNLGKKIVTEIRKAEKFWRAEEEHQNYVNKQKTRK